MEKILVLGFFTVYLGNWYQVTISIKLNPIFQNFPPHSPVCGELVVWACAESFVDSSLNFIFYQRFLTSPSRTGRLETCSYLYISLRSRTMIPVVLAKVIKYFDHETMTKEEGYMYTTLLVLGTFVATILTFHINNQLQILAMRVRIATCSLMYRKV